jgi:hypothetical protein
MVFDTRAYMPGDGSLQGWLDEKQQGKAGAQPQPAPYYVPYYVGIDLGRRRNPSTLVCVEAQYNGAHTAYYFVRHIKRFRLKMLYSDISAEVKKFDTQLRRYEAKQGRYASITYLADSGGVGEGVTEMLVKSLGPNATLYKCYFVGGISYHQDGFEIRIPKSQAVSALQAVFHSNVITLPKGANYVDALLEELANYQASISEEGRDQYGARAGKYDDLTSALMLAIFYAENMGGSGGPSFW